MASLTVSFTGTSSVLRSDFHPAIILDPKSEYCCGLLDFTSYNSIPNITEGQNNKFQFKYTVYDKVNSKDINGNDIIKEVSREKEKTILLSTGSYEVADILHYIKSQLAAINITLTYDINAATSKVKLIFDTPIKCIDNSVLKVIGFNKNIRIFESKKAYWSDSIIKITNIDVIRIECDIVTNSFINGQNCHTIHQFSHCKVSPGYKFVEVPQHIIYLPVKHKHLQSIQISIVDQNGNLIDFRGEQISCRIHIKKVNE